MSDFLDRVDRRSDGGEVVALPVRKVDGRCPWCDDAIDGDRLCSRRCHASRVNRTDDQ